MTEMTDKARKPLHDIDAAVFSIALIAAPFLVALLFFWVYFIPVFAILFGGLPWLLCGGPVLWWTIRTCGPGPQLILMAMIANIAGTPVFTLLTSSFFLTGTAFTDAARFMTGFGMVFSALWGAMFYLLYRAASN